MKTTSTPSQPQVSHKGSITGFVLAVLSLICSGIANLAIHAKYSPTGPTTGSVDKEVGHAVATGTTSILGAIFGMPFIFFSVLLAIVSVAFIVLRLRKVRIGGLIFSIIAVLLVIWSLNIAFDALDLIKAKPAA